MEMYISNMSIPCAPVPALRSEREREAYSLLYLRSEAACSNWHGSNQPETPGELHTDLTQAQFRIKVQFYAQP